MPKLNTTVKSVRIDNDNLAELERKIGSKSINAWLNEQIEAFLYGSKSETGGLPKIAVKPETYRSMESMINFYGGDLGHLIEMLNEAMEKSTVIYEGGSLIGLPQIDLDRYMDVCHEMNVDPQETIYKVAQMVERGQI